MYSLESLVNFLSFMALKLIISNQNSEAKNSCKKSTFQYVNQNHIRVSTSFVSSYISKPKQQGQY